MESKPAFLLSEPRTAPRAEVAFTLIELAIVILTLALLLVNGSVSFVSTETWRSEAAASGRSLAWWNPYNATGHLLDSP